MRTINKYPPLEVESANSFFIIQTNDVVALSLCINRIDDKKNGCFINSFV